MVRCSGVSLKKCDETQFPYYIEEWACICCQNLQEYMEVCQFKFTSAECDFDCVRLMYSTFLVKIIFTGSW